LSNAEIKLINHVIKTGDVITPLNHNVGYSFDIYKEEWDFIVKYFEATRTAPPAVVFFDKFPHIDRVETEGSIEFYINELHLWKAKQSLKDLIMKASMAVRENKSPYMVINKLAKELANISRETRYIRDVDIMSNYQFRLEKLRDCLEMKKSGKSIIGIPTGLPTIDEAFGGWQKGDFVVIAGWTGSYKSWLALYFAMTAWMHGYRVLYFSLEMSSLQIGYRVDTLLSKGEFKNSDLMNANNIQYDKYKNWLGDVSKDSPPFVVVTNEDLDEINQNTVLSKIIYWKPDLVILDYHALFDEASGVKGEVEKTKELSKAFKRIALQTGTPIIDITGVVMTDKKDYGDRPPELYELAWSKQLAYDSDLTMGLCSHGKMLEIVSRKVRRGKNFHIVVKCDVDNGIIEEQSSSIGV
jgi:replicative DNA helicase